MAPRARHVDGMSRAGRHELADHRGAILVQLAQTHTRDDRPSSWVACHGGCESPSSSATTLVRRAMFDILERSGMDVSAYFDNDGGDHAVRNAVTPTSMVDARRQQRPR